MELDPVGLRQPKDGVDAAGGPSLASLPKSLVMPRSSITAAISARAPSYRVTSFCCARCMEFWRPVNRRPVSAAACR